MAAALAPNIDGQLLFRFLAGVCGSTPFTTAEGTLADLFDHQTRGKIFPYFACTASAGIRIGPVAGGYVGESGLNCRGTEWIRPCISSGVLVLVLPALPETYGPVILSGKAAALRSETGNQSYKSDLELTHGTLLARLRTALTRPFTILFSEPMVVPFVLYLTLLYAVSFSFFSSFPYIFGAQGEYGFDQESTYLVFIAIVVELLKCTLATPLFGLLIAWKRRRRPGKGWCIRRLRRCFGGRWWEVRCCRLLCFGWRGGWRGGLVFGVRL
jgi:hypothetical protein